MYKRIGRNVFEIQYKKEVLLFTAEEMEELQEELKALGL
jgi:hypothetical protein